MEMLNQENCELDISLSDFPIICRICLMRGELRLFEEEDYLLDLFVTITKIKVYSTVNLPRNICNECLKKLEDISIYISKYNDRRPGKNLIPIPFVDCGKCHELVVKTEKTSEELEEDIYTEKSETCQICLTSCVTLFGEKAHLMQLFQEITNIDVEAESDFSSRKGLCNKCINELESISSFISLSLCNDMKFEIIIGRNECPKVEMEKNEVKVENDPDENARSYARNKLHTDLDIKEEAHEVPSRCDSQQHTPTNTGKKKFKCGICERFVSRRVFKDHLLTHAGEKPFRCDCCDKSYSAKSSLQKHKLLHTGKKPFTCDICSKSFAYRHVLNNHQITHTGEKPYRCDCCENSFSQKSSLQKHMLTHTGEKPFKCDNCDKRFIVKWNLERHLLTHTQEKPHKCDCCGKSFSQKSNLQQHMLTHTDKK